MMNPAVKSRYDRCCQRGQGSINMTDYLRQATANNRDDDGHHGKPRNGSAIQPSLFEQ